MLCIISKLNTLFLIKMTKLGIIPLRLPCSLIAIYGLEPMVVFHRDAVLKTVLNGLDLNLKISSKGTF